MTLMHIDPNIVIAGAIVGFVIGLTGMGGGALMTPILILVFRVQPLAAVSSDLVASLFMKPVAGFVHIRRGTVHLKLVALLALGSVPAAFAGVFVLRLFGHGQQVQQAVQVALGAALILAILGMVVQAFIATRRPPQARVEKPNEVPLRPLPTILIGAIGGLIVGMTSVGSGSLIIVSMLFLYPRLRAAQLVGTDIVQAIPLVGAAALSHLLYGDFRLSLTASVLIGAIPGAYLGAIASSQAPGRLLRRALAFVLLATSLKLLQVPNVAVAVTLISVAIMGEPAWALLKRASVALMGAPSQDQTESSALIRT